MIEQYTIAATSKYNFPQSLMNTPLPQRLIELSIHSLKHMQNQTVQLNQQILQQDNITLEHFFAEHSQTRVIPLSPKTLETTIAAVDTSSIKLGETSRGVIIAIRGTNVWKKGCKYGYLRVGPFIFHITEENINEVYNSLTNACFQEKTRQFSAFTQIHMRMSNLLERWLQASLAKSMNNGIILFDGSLTAGTSDTPVQQLKEILNAARNMNNTVLAFTKTTTLRFNGYLITDTLATQKPPCLVELINLKPKPPLVLLGDIYVAKLTNGKYAFRLDIDKETPSQQKIEAVQRLLGNDAVTYSYPETLRLAHILCTFTANEVLAMQHFIQQKYRLKIFNRPDMHRLLFGPFGKGESRNEIV